MAQLFGRVARVTIQLPKGNSFDPEGNNLLTINGSDNRVAPGLRIQFKITKSTQKDPNESQLVISNLNPDHRAAVQVKGLRITIDGGYQSTGLQRIFLGDSRTTDQVRAGGDWETTIKLGDGARAFKYARLSESFAPGTGAGDVLTRLANASGLAIGNVPTVVLNTMQTFDSGYVVNGPISESLDRLLKSLGYGWSIQYGTLQVLPPGSSLAAQIPVDSPTSGLIGSPEMGSPEKKGGPRLVKYKTLLTPANPGSQRQLKSERYSGIVTVKKSELEGDTRGGPWYSTIYGVVHG